MRIVKFRLNDTSDFRKGVLHGFVSGGDHKITAIVEILDGPTKAMCVGVPVTEETFGFEEATPEFIDKVNRQRAMAAQGMGGPGNIIPG